MALFFLVATLLYAGAAHAGTVSNERPLLFTFDGSDTSAGAFTGSQRVGVDQASGSVYVLDAGHGVVDKFNPDGSAANFSVTGTSSLSGSETPQSSFEFGGSDGDISIDNAGGATQGRIYIGGASHPVNAFSASGGYLWQLSQSLFSNNCGTAVDAAGHLWVGDYGGFKAFEFDNAGSPPPQIGSVDTESRACRLNVDASGNLFPVFYEGRVDKYVGGTFASTLDPGTNYDVAIDQSSATGHLFTIHGESFSEYESSGALVSSFGADLIGQGRGIAYDKALDRVYVVDQASNTVKVFGPVASGTVPDVTIEASSELSLHGAKFNGKINPRSLPNSYHFEWKEGEGSSWGAAKSSPPQSIEPTDGSQHTVSFSPSGLRSNTKYQVRLVGTNAENGLNAYSGADTFTTPSPPLPAVTIASPASITTTTANVGGTVNPEGDATGWHLQISTDPACALGFSDQPSHDLGSEGTSPVPVSEELTGLLPNQYYCVRISATNPGGTTNSEVKEFTTAPVVPTQVFTAFASPRLNTSARLNGRVNPQGATATYPLIYRFEYSKDGGATWVALPDQQYTGGAREQIVVGSELPGLDPNTPYSFRFSAENAAGPALSQGGSKTFTTRTSAEVAAPGRGSEMVNTPDKGNQNVFSQVEDVAALPITSDGEKALWYVTAGVPGGTSSSGNAFLAERTPGGWVSRNLVPGPEQQFGGGDLPYFLEKANSDFTSFVFNAGSTVSVEGHTLLRLNAGQGQEVLKTYEGTGSGKRSEISEDGAHVLVVSSDTHQLEDIGTSPPGLVSVMPSGSASECGLNPLGPSFVGPDGNRAGAGNSWNAGYRRASKDTSRVYFETRPDGECGARYALFERNRESDETTLVDTGAAEHDSYLIRVTPDGRHAYFATWSKLDPADGNGNADVYRWDEESGESSCLTCVVADANIATTGGRLREVLVSDDFSHVYFQSEEQLLPGQGKKGALNTYAVSGGEIHFVGGRGVGFLESPFAFLSADGNVLVFRSSIDGGVQTLSGDRMSGQCGEVFFGKPAICEQLYRYDDRDGSMECISCHRDAETTLNAGSPSAAGGASDFRLSADGDTVAFITKEALVPLDVNQNSDVYEWRNGVVRLVTDGVRSLAKGLAAPAVRGVDEDGANIFFIAAVPGLTGFEEDGLTNFYDARIGGGFEPPGPPVPCSGDSCQGPLQAAPAKQQPGSSSFVGRGNTREGKPRPRCAKHKVRRRGRCVTRHVRHKRASHANQGRTK
jgi:hypothetical protein